eukprot:Clim_evm9s27 gene=Clim_evmTU9s27
MSGVSLYRNGTTVNRKHTYPSEALTLEFQLIPLIDFDAETTEQNDEQTWLSSVSRIPGKGNIASVTEWLAEERQDDTIWPPDPVTQGTAIRTAPGEQMHHKKGKPSVVRNNTRKISRSTTVVNAKMTILEQTSPESENTGEDDDEEKILRETTAMAEFLALEAAVAEDEDIEKNESDLHRHDELETSTEYHETELKGSEISPQMAQLLTSSNALLETETGSPKSQSDQSDGSDAALEEDGDDLNCSISSFRRRPGTAEFRAQSPIRAMHTSQVQETL